MLLPICMYLAGSALGLMVAVEMVEESMAYVMMLMAVLLVAAGGYSLAGIGGSIGHSLGPVLFVLGGAMLILAGLNVYELHHKKTCCCAKSTLEKWLVRSVHPPMPTHCHSAAALSPSIFETPPTGGSI